METPSNPLLRLCDVQRASRRSAKRRPVRSPPAITPSRPPTTRTPWHSAATSSTHSTDQVHRRPLGRRSAVRSSWSTTTSCASKLAFLPEHRRRHTGTDGLLPHHARNVKTLHLRMERHARKRASQIAQADLEGSPASFRNTPSIPGLPSHPQYELAQTADANRRRHGLVRAQRQRRGLACGSHPSFEVFALAESLGGVESLVDHPVSMTHGSIPREERMKAGFNDGLIRLSVGIEDIDDLRADVRAAIAVL